MSTTTAQDHVTFTSGAVIKIKPISLRLLQKFDLSHTQPKPPLVPTTATIGGLEEMVEDASDKKYQEELAAYNEKTTNDFMNMLLSFGTHVELPADTKWIDRLSRVGITVTEDTMAEDYIQYCLMENFTDDLRLLTAGVLRASGVSEEAISSWMSMFPSSVG